MKNITKEWFKKQSPCEDGYRWVRERKDITVKGTIDELMNIGRFDWANWTLIRLLRRKQKIQYAIFVAEQVLDIFEKKHPDDKRPRLAIESAKTVLKKDNKENRNAAAYAANAAAYATDATAYADYVTAYDASATAYAAYAANAAVYAAYATTNTDYATAYAATNAAAYATDAANVDYATKKEMQTKILSFGMNLLGMKADTITFLPPYQFMCFVCGHSFTTNDSKRAIVAGCEKCHWEEKEKE